MIYLLEIEYKERTFTIYVIKENRILQRQFFRLLLGQKKEHSLNKKKGDLRLYLKEK